MFSKKINCKKWCIKYIVVYIETIGDFLEENWFLLDDGFCIRYVKKIILLLVSIKYIIKQQTWMNVYFDSENKKWA